MAALDDFGLPGGPPNLDAARQHCALITALYRNDQATARGVMRLDGGEAAIQAWVHQPQLLPPSWAVFRQEQRYFIVFAGTTNRSQWGRHLVGISASPFDGGPTLAHSFFLQSADQIGALLQPHLPAPAEGVRIYLSGHSFGGAVAGILACRYAKRYGADVVKLITFAQPRFFTNLVPQDRPAIYYRYHNYGDIVTDLPPISTRFWLGDLGTVKAIITRFRISASDILNRPGGDIRSDGEEGYQSWRHFGVPVRVSPLSGPTVGRDFQEFAGGGQSWGPNSVRQHSIHAYADYLFNAYRRAGGSQTTPALERLRDDCVRNTPEPDDTTDVAPASYLDFATAAARAFPGVAGITPDSILRGEQVTFLLGDYRRVQRNILDFGEKSSMAFYKFTAFLRGGPYGRSHSIVQSTPAGLAVATARARIWVTARAQLLGNRQAARSPAGDTPPPGAPGYTHFRVSDALLTSPGELVEIENTIGQGPGTGQGNKEPDFFATSVAVKVRGQIDGPPVRSRTHIETFVGQPDDQVLDGNRLAQAVSVRTAGTTWMALLLDYLNLLTSDPVAPFGFMGFNPAARKVPLTNWFMGPAGYVRCTAAAHTWETGDVIQVTGRGTRRARGRWKVIYVDANTLDFPTMRLLVGEMPNILTGRRYATKAGVMDLVFYRFVAPAAGWVPPFGARVAKRNVNRAFEPVSFPHKGRQGR